jgi:hypothetical protein
MDVTIASTPVSPQPLVLARLIGVVDNRDARRGASEDVSG